MRTFKLIASIIFAIFYCISSFSQTDVGGVINSETTWTKANSPYLINNSIYIMSGTTLTIEPGVIVDFTGPFFIQVEGVLLAVGTPADSISFKNFRSHGDDGQYAYIELNGPGSLLKYVNILPVPGEMAGNVYVKNSSIENSSLENINHLHITESSTLENSSCFFDLGLGGGGVQIDQYSYAFGNSFKQASISLSDSSILNNNQIYLSHSEFSSYSSTVEYNTFIDLDEGESIIGLTDDNASWNFPGIFQYNTILGCKKKVEVRGGEPLIRNNNFDRKFPVFIDPNFEPEDQKQYNIAIGEGSEYPELTTIPVKGNYWGTDDKATIDELLYDFNNDFSVLGIFDYEPYLSIPDTAAPISPPKLISRDTVNGSTVISWEPNIETDLAGYRIYFGSFNGKSFSDTIDVGNVNAYTLPDTKFYELVVLTAYDIHADGFNDIVEGHESLIFNQCKPVADIKNGYEVDLCEGDTITMEINYQEYSFHNRYEWFWKNTYSGEDQPVEQARFKPLRVPVEGMLPYFTSGEFMLVATSPNGMKDTSEYSLVKVFQTELNQTTIPVSCGGQIITDLSSNYDLNDLEYLWRPSAGLSDSTIPNPILLIDSHESTNEYELIITSRGNCESTYNLEVSSTVVDLPAEICFVSVNENDNNIIVWKRPDGVLIDSFYVFRESSIQTNKFDLIGRFAYEDENMLIDVDSDASVQSNMYKISMKDACGNYTVKSSPHKTMHLTVNKGFSNTWNLIWEPYEGAYVSGYKIYRGNSPSTLEHIGSSSANNTTYTDEDVSGGHKYYQIEMTLPANCSTSILKSSDYSSTRSNIISTEEASAVSDFQSNTLKIYPNPARDILSVDVGLNYNDSKNCLLKMINSTGLLILETRITEQVHVVDVSAINQKGLHIVQIYDNSGLIIGTCKIVIE